MNPRRPFLYALMASLALHLGVLSGAAWHLPSLDDLLEPDAPAPIEARLVPAPVPAPAVKPASPRRTKPRPPAPRPVATPVPEPVVEPAAEPAAEAEAEPVPEPTPEPVVEAAAGPEAARAAEAEPLRAGDDVELPTRNIPLPYEVRLRYVVKMGEAGFVIGQAAHEWRHDGVRYVLRSTAETTGLAAVFKQAAVVHVSRGEIVEGSLRPGEFRIERNGVAGDWARFDWQAGRVAMSGGARQAQLAPGTQDMISMFGQLALVPLVDRPSVGFDVATGKKVEHYEFKVLGMERITTPLGERQTIHLRNERPGGDSTDIWLADGRPAQLPLMIRHVDRHGVVFDQVADRMEYDGVVEEMP